MCRWRKNSNETLSYQSAAGTSHPRRFRFLQLRLFLRHRPLHQHVELLHAPLALLQLVLGQEEPVRHAAELLRVVDGVGHGDPLQGGELAQRTHREPLVHQAVVDEHVHPAEQGDPQARPPAHGGHEARVQEAVDAQAEGRDGVRHRVNVVGLEGPRPRAMVRRVQRPAGLVLVPEDPVSVAGIKLHPHDRSQGAEQGPVEVDEVDAAVGRVGDEEAEPGGAGGEAVHEQGGGHGEQPVGAPLRLPLELPLLRVLASPLALLLRHAAGAGHRDRLQLVRFALGRPRIRRGGRPVRHLAAALARANVDVREHLGPHGGPAERRGALPLLLLLRGERLHAAPPRRQPCQAGTPGRMPRPETRPAPLLGPHAARARGPSHPDAAAPPRRRLRHHSISLSACACACLCVARRTNERRNPLPTGG
mmetsp:Transcript_33948/g.73473  ORF Transcript_33948/g.73473 Transcript_33948/m.73473 type:complete len:420 (-) Transcript_33948:141-1400(-)